MEVISEGLERKVALRECEGRKWRTSSFSATVMPCNLAGGGRCKRRLKKKKVGMMQEGERRKRADIQGHTEERWRLDQRLSGRVFRSVELLASLFSNHRVAVT